MSPYSIPSRKFRICEQPQGLRRTVVDHLDVVSGSSLTDPVTARLAVCLRSSSLEDLLDSRPGGGGPTGHQGRTVTRTLLTSRDTRANKQEALGLKLLGATD